MRKIISLSLVDRGGYLTVVLVMERENNLVVRRSENLRDWYNTVQGMVKDSKRKQMKSTEEFWTKKTPIHLENTEAWHEPRARTDEPQKHTGRHSAGSLDRGRGRNKGERANDLKKKIVFHVHYFQFRDRSKEVQVKGALGVTNM